MGEPARHPAEEALLGYLEGAREESLEAHLAACRRCRQALMGLQDLTRGAPARDRRWLPLAAASLLLTASAWWLASRHPDAAVAPPPASEPLASGVSGALPLPGPGEVWNAAEGDAEALAGDAVLLALRRGGILRVGKQELTLEKGVLFVESHGERVTLRLGTLGTWKVEMDEGLLAAEVPAAPAFSWLLGEACAAEAPDVRLTLVRGLARLTGPTGAREIRAGESLGEPLRWTEAPWIPLAEGVSAVRDGARVFLKDPPEGGYVFEALIRKRAASAEAGVLFQVLGRSWEVPVGGNLLAAKEGWSRIRVQADASGCSVALGGRLLVSCAAGQLERKLCGASERGVGLRAWGGDLEVRDARWRRPGR